MDRNARIVEDLAWVPGCDLVLRSLSGPTLLADHRARGIRSGELAAVGALHVPFLHMLHAFVS